MVLLFLETVFAPASAASPWRFKSYGAFVLMLKGHAALLTRSLLVLIAVLFCLIIWEIVSWSSSRKKVEMDAEVHVVGSSSTVAPEEDPFRSRMREVSETMTPPPPGPAAPVGPFVEESFPPAPPPPPPPPPMPAPPRHPVIETGLGMAPASASPEPFNIPPREEKILSFTGMPSEPPPAASPAMEAPATAPPPPRKERKPLNLDLNMVEEDPWKALLRTSQKDNETPPPPSPEESPEAPAPLSEPAAAPSAPALEPAAGLPPGPLPESSPRFPVSSAPRPALALDLSPEKEMETGPPRKLRSGDKEERDLRKKALELEETLKKVQSSKTEGET